MKKSDYLIIIPAYNEEKNIGETIKTIQKVVPEAPIVVIDDGSSDHTESVAEAHGALVVSHPINLGDGAARQTGFQYALNNNYDYVINLDADGQHAPQDIPRILEALRKEKHDIIIGSRFLGSRKYTIPFLRRVGMFIFSVIIAITTRQRISDPTSGFRGVNKKAMKFYVKVFYPEYYPDADVIIASHFAGLNIQEIPVDMHQRTYGKSLHSGLSPIYYIFKMCLSIFASISIRRRIHNGY